MTTPTPDTALVRARIAAVTDPEIPVLTIEDLGVLRDVEVGPDGSVLVTITPTYSGCPAMDEIRADIRSALDGSGHSSVTVRTVLSPAWTTDWMSAEGRRKLKEFGIAPPGPRAAGPVTVGLGRTRTLAAAAGAPGPACPRCGATDTEELSRFGSTSCKSLWRCRACREPFDHFKAH